MEIKTVYIPILAFSKHGGMRVLSCLANKWAESGISVYFMVNQFSQPPYFDLSNKINIIWLNEKGLKVEHRSDSGELSGIWGVLKNLLLLRKGLQNYVTKNSVILANHSLTSFPVRFLKKGGIKKFYYIQAYEPDYYQLTIHKKISGIFLYLLSSISYFFNLNKIVNGEIYKKYKLCSATEVIYPGVDRGIFYQSEPVHTNKKMVIGCVGRAETHKGSIYAYNAFLALEKQYPGKFEFKIAYFKPPSCPGLLITPKNDRELSDFYRSLDILVITGISQFGAFHYPLVEGMSCGCSIITTPYYPATSKNAWLIKPKNSQVIIKTIEEIIDNPELVNTKRIQALSDCLQFDWTSQSKKMLDIFSRVP